ncbi:class I SAM-dependent methyltransferase [Aestuariispira insulae]|uniref:Methyltransferase family protein n=1 Tax=Aestuariispira insulae TaxID=1461337 RepID=A0A3D9HIQ3_9PROT|nr:class I SAM-dependent methyltransferase [Aestuariispira insulae]RED49151.1 methyltransferase family protein [Aestuariispira insulae]
MIISNGNQGRILPKIDGQILQVLMDILDQYPDEALQIPRMIEMLAAARISLLKEEDISVADPEAGGVADYAISHNLNQLKEMIALDRPLHLINPLRSIALVMERVKSLKVLTVGPRTEVEIYGLIACGFDPVNVTGLDLISYSPFIDVGDMHAMPYPDNSFDVLVMGWVLAYSTDHETAAREALRVTKPGGFFAIGCQYVPPNAEGGYDTPSKKLFNHTDDILALFGDEIEAVFFRHDIHPTRLDKPGAVMTIFQRKG